MAKELSIEQIRNKTFRFVIDELNQYLKNLTTLVYFGSKKRIYMKQEKYLRYAYFGKALSYPVDYTFIMYDTLKMAEFKKEYRYSNATADTKDDGIIVTHNQKAKNPDARLELLRVASDSDNLNEMEKSIIHDMYRKPELVFYDCDNPWYQTTKEQIELLQNSEMVTFTIQNDRAYVTKAVFPMIAKVDSLECRTIPFQSQDDNQITYFQFREYFESLDLYVVTAIAAYQSI